MNANKGEFPVLSSVCSTKDYLSALRGDDHELSNVGALTYPSPSNPPSVIRQVS